MSVEEIITLKMPADYVGDTVTSQRRGSPSRTSSSTYEEEWDAVEDGDCVALLLCANTRKRSACLCCSTASGH